MTDHERKGIGWWNGLSQSDRRFWLACAVSVTPADAWAYYKGVLADPELRATHGSERVR